MTAPLYFQSDLMPYAELIRELIKQGNTLKTIAYIIERNHGILLSSVSIGKFVRANNLRPPMSRAKVPPKPGRTDYTPRGAAANLDRGEVMDWISEGLTTKKMSDFMSRKGYRVPETSIQRYIRELGLRQECETIAAMGQAHEYLKAPKPTPAELLPGTERLERQSIRRYRHPSPGCFICGSSHAREDVCIPCLEGMDIPYDRQHHDPCMKQRKKLMERIA